MALNSGLFQGQDQNEQDMLNSPGWTIDEQKPGMFDDAIMALPRGIAQAGGNIAATLAHGFQNTDSLLSFIGNPVGAALATADALKHPDYTAPPPGVLADVENTTRNYAKSLTPDPRVAGSAANLIQGFGRSVTEFVGGTLAGGPEVGAAVLGVSEGHARYHDLKDAGVDDQTARAGALIEGIAAGGGALLPMGMPAKWLASLSTAGELAAQAGAGAAINTTFGYASAKILENAGYPEMAKQQEPFDTGNLMADMVSGLFFGAHHGWGELNQAHVDPSVRDAAKVVQDRQAVTERAPGIPVDMRSMAVNRAALEQGMGDLLTGKSVDESQQNVEGAEFARRPQDEFSQEARDLIAGHFKESGVFEAADAHDAWLRGPHDEMEPTTPEVSAIDGKLPERASETPEPERPISEQVPAERKTGDYILSRGSGEAGFPLVIDRESMMRGRLEKPEALNQEGMSQEHNDAMTQAWDKEARESFDADGNFTGKRFQVTTGRGVYHFDTQGAARDFAETHGMKAGKRRQLQDVPPGKAEATEAPKLASTPLTDRPDLQIANAQGEPIHAGQALDQASAESAQANKEADPMFNAAVNCEARRGS